MTVRSQNSILQILRIRSLLKHLHAMVCLYHQIVGTTDKIVHLLGDMPHISNETEGYASTLYKIAHIISTVMRHPKRRLVIAGQMSQKIRQHGGEAPADDNRALASVAEEKRETAIEGESQETTTNDILLTQAQIDELLQKVSAVMGDVDVISRGDFTLVALAQMVGSNTRYVSWVINNTYHKNFKTLLNEYRIREVCRRMEDKANFGHLTIQALSNSLGYSSPSNFLRAFKNVNGMTPSMYQKLISEKKIDEAGE